MKSSINQNSSENESRVTQQNVQQGDTTKSNSEELDYMNNLLHKKFPSFFENFELLDYTDVNDTGIIFKGLVKTKINKNKLFSFKFYNEMKNGQKNLIWKHYEILNQKKLHHKNISRMLAFRKMNDDNYFSVSEFGEHGNLNDFIHKFLKKNFVSETFVNYLAKQILEALNYMHQKKIYHMDINKHNIVVDNELNIKLINFSSTINFESHQPNDLLKLPIKGTGYFMPPEILKGEPIEIKYGTKVDLYSLGVTLYNLAFGSYPFDLDKVKKFDYDKISEHLDKTSLEFPEDIKISKKFENFLKNILEKDYLKRYSIKDAMNDPWIKGWDFINEEKENTKINYNFIVRLMYNHIHQFNEFIKSE